MLGELPGWAVVKNSPANAGDARNVSLIPGLGRSTGGGNGNPLQYSCLGNPMDRGAWRATVHGVTKSWTRLSTHTHKTQNLKYYRNIFSDIKIFTIYW